MKTQNNRISPGTYVFIAILFLFILAATINFAKEKNLPNNQVKDNNPQAEGIVILKNSGETNLP